MNLKSRILGVSAGVALAVGMAGPAFAGAPVVETGATAFDQGSMATRGGCSTVAIGTILNAAKTAGLDVTEEAMTSSSKGYARTAADTAALRVGQCSLQQRLGVTGTAVNFGGINYVNKDVAKFGTKLTSTATDCNSVEGSDLDERPLAGKMSIGFSDLSKLDAYIRVQGFDTAAADKVWLTGIVAKGEAAGATIGGNVWFNPAYKAKTAIGYYGDTVGDDPKTTGVNESGVGVDTDPGTPGVQEDVKKVIATGYATSVGFTISEAIGCSLGTPGTVGLGYGVPGLDLIGLGGGSGYASLGLNTTADGVQFLL